MGIIIVLWILSLYVTYLHAKINWLEEKLKELLAKEKKE